ncbi:MAG: SNF2-related protein, partial [Candidatus Promineifilaceae bacterium]
MPTIFDNINEPFLRDELRRIIGYADRADFAVGYFNLRGWKTIANYVDDLPGNSGPACRLLIGMPPDPEKELREALALGDVDGGIDQGRARRALDEMLRKLREQLVIGAPTNEDESGLRQLKRQLVDGQVIVKLHLRHRLHAKLYLLHLREDQSSPRNSYLGSSNLTFSGLAGQGELNIDVVDRDANHKLADWFEDRWNDRFSVDVTQQLIEILEESWAREKLIPPYHIYLNMAYHLSREARAGLAEFTIPAPFDTLLFDFQKAAVQIAARHLNQRGGVLIGDVVGLGKTLMATALARIFEEDQFLETLIICPKSLERMWQWHVDEYRLRARVMPISQVLNRLEELRRYRLVLIDESHNLRNREGKRYKVIRDYIQANDSRVILLSATPYNKTYHDLSNQLRLFLPEDADLGIRPETLLREIGILEFNKRYESPPPRSLQAFEKS